MPSKTNWQPWIGTILMLIAGLAGWLYAAGAKRATDDAEIRSLKISYSKLEGSVDSEIKLLRTNQSAMMALMQAVNIKVDVISAEQRILHRDQLYLIPRTPAVGSLVPDPARVTGSPPK